MIVGVENVLTILESVLSSGSHTNLTAANVSMPSNNSSASDRSARQSMSMSIWARKLQDRLATPKLSAKLAKATVAHIVPRARFFPYSSQESDLRLEVLDGSL